MARPRTTLVFGDVHFPHANMTAVAVVKRAAEMLKPDLIVCLGDLLDCGQFSTHPPTWGVAETNYEDDLSSANGLLDHMQKHAQQRVAMVEGNHEYRIDRWAAATSEGRGAYNLLAPRIMLSRGRSKFTYVPYGSADGKYPHYKINNRLVAVHGWSYARHATKNHLQISQGMSVIHGHTHRADSSIQQNIWSEHGIVQAHSAGCLCKRIPMYGVGNPVEWVNAFVLLYSGRRDDTIYTIPIVNDRAILPDGREVKA